MEQNVVQEGLLSALGLTLKNIVAGAIGSFVALRFFEKLTPIQKWTTFMGGWALAAYLGTPVTQYFELKPNLEAGITLIVGLFGMSLTAAIIKAIQDIPWAKMLQDAVQGVIDRFKGGKP